MDEFEEIWHGLLKPTLYCMMIAAITLIAILKLLNRIRQ